MCHSIPQPFIYLHLIHIVSVIPEDVLKQLHSQHSLDQIAWQTVDRKTPANLAYLIRDYLGHLKVHLDQILASSSHPNIETSDRNWHGY